MDNQILSHVVVIDLANNNDVDKEGIEEHPQTIVIILDDNENNKEMEELPNAVVINLMVNSNDDQGQTVVQEELDKVACEGVNCQKALLVSEEMRVAWISQYVSGIIQIMLVINEHHITATEALTIGGNHFTSCKWCCLDDTDGCFWIMTGIMLNLEGCQVQNQNSTMHNNNVCHNLYDSFIDEEYLYLQGSKNRQIGLPHMPLLSISNIFSQ